MIIKSPQYLQNRAWFNEVVCRWRCGWLWYIRSFKMLVLVKKVRCSKTSFKMLAIVSKPNDQAEYHFKTLKISIYSPPRLSQLSRRCTWYEDMPALAPEFSIIATTRPATDLPLVGAPWMRGLPPPEDDVKNWCVRRGGGVSYVGM